jgi:hypothetical protein
VHERTILFLHRRYFVVLDAIAALGAHEWALHWHVAPDLTVGDAGPSSVRITDPSRGDADLLAIVALGDGALERGASWRSLAYGARREAAQLTYASAGTGRQTAVTLLVPGAAHARAGESSAGHQTIDIAGGSFRDQVVRRGRDATIALADVTTDAECAVLTTNADGGRDRLYLLGASFVEGGGLERQQISSGDVFAACHELGGWVARPIFDRSPE